MSAEELIPFLNFVINSAIIIFLVAFSRANLQRLHDILEIILDGHYKDKISPPTKHTSQGE